MGSQVVMACSLSLQLLLLLLLFQTVGFMVSFSAAASAGAALGPQTFINCGGGTDFDDIFQRTWSKDTYSASRLSVVGMSSVTDVNGTENYLIYQSARLFPAHGSSSPPLQQRAGEGGGRGGGEGGGGGGGRGGGGGNATYPLVCEEGSRYFLRLHFNAFPFTSNGTSFDPARANFSVLADSVTLLRNWSPLLEQGVDVNTAVVKEFSLVCQPGGVMNVVFIPISPSSSSSSSPQLVEPGRGNSSSSSLSSPSSPSPPSSPSYAFINAIEHVYIPPGLYGGAKLHSLASVTVIRWNCGGRTVSPGSDRLFRTWTPDPERTKATTNQVQPPTVVAGCNVAPAFIPDAVMATERLFGGDNPSSFSVDYEIPAEANATYFVRMYFADLWFRVVGTRVMDLAINGVVREEGVGVDPIKEVGALNATWRDFVVGQSSSPSPDTISVSIRVNPQSLKRNPQISGLEVFKLGQGDLSSSADDLRVVEAPDGRSEVVARPSYSMETAGRILHKFTEFEGNSALLPQWMMNSDPCNGWTGVWCHASGQGIITRIDLSFAQSTPSTKGLGGEIPPELGQITTLTHIVLSNHRFTGVIPDSLGNLSFLQNLALENNQLTGSIPATFGRLRQLASLTVQFNSLSGEVPKDLLTSSTLTNFLSVGGNNTLCAPSTVDATSTRDLKYCTAEIGPSGKKGTTLTVTVVAVVTVVGACLVIALTVFLVMRRRRNNESLLGSYTDSDYASKACKNVGGGGRGKGLPDSDKKVGQRFTLQELRKATDDFDHTKVIGTGGFGNVYKGVLEDGDVVAIKRGSPESKQGMTEFQTEIITLSKLRHRHLVSLVGYCDDEGEMILVYEYMALGTLRGHLYGKTCGTEYSPLSWRKRLEIAIGSARGLDYLHSGTEEMVIHRDVKSTNILLDDKYVAKVADFGLSKSGPSGFNETHISTAVKGSFGYLDPAYFKSQQLTEKSDVYSFGVVLLEVITARAPISQNLPKEQVNLADWAVPYLLAGKVEQIVDPKLVDTYGTASLDKVAKVALCCLGEDRDTRPSMMDVRRGLEDALVLQDTSLSVVLDTPPAPMMCVNYDSEYHDYTNATATSDPPSPPDSVLMAR